MDAKERHELKDNDLAEFLEHFGEFWGKHGNGIMIAIIIFMLVLFGWRYYNNSNAVAHENAWADLSATTTPQGFRERAVESAGFSAVPQLALLRGAETFHQQAIQLNKETANQEDTGMMSAEESLDAAESMYNQVLSSNTDPVYQANAAVGLANVAETRHDFDAAREHWTKAKQLAEGAKLNAIATLADLRMGMLDDLAKPIVFDESAPADEPAADTATDDAESSAVPVDAAAPPAAEQEAVAPATATPGQ